MVHIHMYVYGHIGSINTMNLLHMTAVAHLEGGTRLPGVFVRRSDRDGPRPPLCKHQEVCREVEVKKEGAQYSRVE